MQSTHKSLSHLSQSLAVIPALLPQLAMTYVKEILAVLLIGRSLAAASTAPSIGKPEVLLGLNTATRSTSAFGGLEPNLYWSSGITRVGDVDVDGGVRVKVEDVDVYPYNLWARAKRTVAGWDVTARADAFSEDLSTLAFDLRAENGNSILDIQGSADAKAQRSFVSKLSLSQKLLGGSLTVVPAYRPLTKEAELGVLYSGLEDTIISLDASTSGPQMITVSQKVGDYNQVIPSISSSGDVEIEYRRAVTGGMVAANYKPNESVTLKWNDGPWLAALNVPMTGPMSFSKDVNVSFKREVLVF